VISAILFLCCLLLFCPFSFFCTKPRDLLGSSVHVYLCGQTVAHLSNSAELLFNNIIHMCLSLFTLSQNKTNCNCDCELARHTWKLSLHYLVKCRTHSSDGRCIASLQTLAALKTACCDMWQLECQASNVTASVQSDHLLHGYTLPLATDKMTFWIFQGEVVTA